VYAYELSATFVLAGEVATFDRAGFKRALLAVFTDARDATLTVTSASVVVHATLLFGVSTQAHAAATSITTTPVGTMQDTWFAALGVTITQAPTASVSSVVVQRSRLDGPMAQRASSDQLDSGAIAGIVVGSIIGAALAGCSSLGIEQLAAAGIGSFRVSSELARALQSPAPNELTTSPESGATMSRRWFPESATQMLPLGRHTMPHALSNCDMKCDDCKRIRAMDLAAAFTAASFSSAVRARAAARTAAAMPTARAPCSPPKAGVRGLAAADVHACPIVGCSKWYPGPVTTTGITAS
jgi:hypothetical protein